MDGPKPRVNKYGKYGKRVLVHDLFDVASQPNKSYTTPRGSPIESLMPSRGATLSSQASEDREISRQLNNELLTTWGFEKSRLRSPARKTTSPRSMVASSMFEIESSGEEEPATKKPQPKTYKRRKITPTGSDAETRDIRGRSCEPMAAGVPNAFSKQTAEGVMGGKAADKTATSGSIEANPKIRTTRRPGGASSARHSPKRSITLKPLTLSAPSTPPRHSPTDLGSPVSDISVASMVSSRSATKRKREAFDGPASDVSSPSQLELSSLRLTPQRTSHPKSRSSAPENEDITMTSPPKVHKRLIDQLEVASPRRAEQPAGQSGSTEDRDASQPPHPRRTHYNTSLPELIAEFPRKPERESSQGQHDTAKPRKYGKQRSHLRDLGKGNTQRSGSQSLDELVSRVDMLPNSQQPQFDLDMSDSEDDGLHLKSIHELRQAGALNRYDRDLDSLLEDIGSDTKGLRISGLMQLVRKLKEQSFKRHVLDHGKVGRLTGLIRVDMDIISASVMLLALWTLAHSESATGHIMLQLYEGILKLPAELMQESRSLSKMAKSPKQNLSKALIRDLFDFESHVLDQSASSGRQTSHIVISRIAIRAIEVILRRVIASGQCTRPDPKPWLEAAIVAIQTHLNALKESLSSTVPEHVESIRLILAWLELSEASSGSIGRHLSDKQITRVGKLLAEVLSWAREENVAIEHSCLKLAIEMSNQKGSVARLLVSADFSTGAFAIVEKHFPKLADKAVKGLFKGEDDADSDKLSSVILALGSLLDFVDSAEEVRLQMTDDREGKGSQVDHLVKMFRLYVDETDEAIDESKTAILIPFGYISLLLCTLSLNDEIRQHISGTIGRSFGEVVERAAIFLERMRSINPDAAFVERFVERFLVTIESVKAKSRA